MKKTSLLMTVFCLTIMPCLAVLAQTLAAGAADTTVSKPVDMFYKSVNESSHLFNGTEYIMYDQHIKGDPYFIPDVSPGAVFYDGTLYKNVPMLYELINGRLVIRQYNNGVLINLINEKVGYFNLYNHQFIHIVPDSGNTVITNDFYDRIYNGNVALYVRRQKIMFEDPSTYERSFIITDRYFMHKNNMWYPIHSQGDMLALFKEKKKDITKYLRQNKIKYKKDPENAMIKMAEYYDTLTH